MAKKKFNIEVEMEERWIPEFLSMLEHMEHCGDIGTSQLVAMYADGDGDFRPKFKPDVDYDYEEPKMNGIFRVWDAG